MAAVFLSPLYLLVNLFLFRCLLRWMASCHRYLRSAWFRVPAAAVYAFFALSVLAGFLMPPGPAKRFLKAVGNYWLGVMLYTVLVAAAAGMLRLILRAGGKYGGQLAGAVRLSAPGGALCILLILAVSVGGFVNARVIRTAEYEVTVEKDAGKLDSLKVVLAADLHLGCSIGCAHMERMAAKINAAEPDLVVFAGDIFDNEYEMLEDADRLIQILRGIRSRYGMYACYGNHDIQEKILAGFTFGGDGRKKVSDPRMDAFLEKAGIRLLQDEYVLIDDSFYLYGRPDAKRPGRGIDVRKTPAELTADLDRSKPVLVMDHQPRELQELADAGVDVDLSGHTHDGQMFPVSLVTRLMWENPCGYLQKGKMHSIVTSGVGLFGPNMRVGTRAEICVVKIRFRRI